MSSGCAQHPPRGVQGALQGKSAGRAYPVTTYPVTGNPPSGFWRRPRKREPLNAGLVPAKLTDHQVLHLFFGWPGRAGSYFGRQRASLRSVCAISRGVGCLPRSAVAISTRATG